jgi:hypothetical protein
MRPFFGWQKIRKWKYLDPGTPCRHCVFDRTEGRSSTLKKDASQGRSTKNSKYVEAIAVRSAWKTCTNFKYAKTAIPANMGGSPSYRKHSNFQSVRRTVQFHIT